MYNMDKIQYNEKKKNDERKKGKKNDQLKQKKLFLFLRKF